MSELFDDHSASGAVPSRGEPTHSQLRNIELYRLIQLIQWHLVDHPVVPQSKGETCQIVDQIPLNMLVLPEFMWTRFI